ncbi:zinc finger CCCH-type with G patch domain-containing protein [Harpegnathos saltator]|uniref:Zinc finger CCCH-type with G patch domain-containing protein n=1 Tax=Harpegnathos saltator TaxID=610380 RepID=E2BTC9_HARSA|nr:zinc finger CCCH-type with G patch domain-containing protein [Harpegnathos saltator]EFN81050.1 Zinc finger CCCH-type with G patch domain-containing protein [Harpegnathos saltator]
MTDVKSLRKAIEQYETQLSQVNATLTSTPVGSNRDNLLSLKSDIEELISLTKESLQSLEGNNAEEKGENEDPDDKMEDPLDKEYALFKAELDQSSDDEESTKQDNRTATNTNSIEEELKELEGMKCKAPYGSNWCGTGYHNAMICSIYRNSNEKIKDIHDIKVRVFFLNPTHKEMIPCPYFLDGNCKFSDENCHYSHGEIVAFSSLQEYKDPDFHSIKMGSRVLAKQKNNMWHRSVVLKLPEKEGGEYRVKFEASGKITEVNLQDLLPLGDADLEMSDTSDDSDEDDSEPNSPTQSEIQSVHKSLFTLQSDEPLGNWERHTRGIGSKLMMQMGYVVGTGLGKHGDGRIQPVEATVLPAGKSLDHCMELREFAGGDKDLFSAERKMRKQQQKLEQQRERQYQKEKERENSNVFNFINKTLGDKPKDDNVAGSSRSGKLRKESNYNLNVASFQVGENISRLKRESSKLKESMSRHTKGSVLYNNIVMKYNEKQKELTNLRASEKNIVAEQNQRKDKAKLTIF